MLRTILVSSAFLLLVHFADADALRYRFVPIDGNGAMKQVPAGPGGAVGELRVGFGMVQPYQHTHRANQMLTLVHPHSQRQVVVPLTLPEGAPRIQHNTDSTRLNYGSYFIDINYLTDGSVETIYNSGFLRPLRLQ